MRYLQYGQIKTTNRQFWTFRVRGTNHFVCKWEIDWMLLKCL